METPAVNRPSSPIVTDPTILGGKPHIVGTRLSVDLLQSLIEVGWSIESVLGVYPYLKAEELSAALAHPGKS